LRLRDAELIKVDRDLFYSGAGTGIDDAKDPYDCSGSSMHRVSAYAGVLELSEGQNKPLDVVYSSA